MAANINVAVVGVADEAMPSLFQFLVEFIEKDVGKKRGERTAESITVRFVSRLVALREMLSHDVEAAYAGDPAAAGYDEIVVAFG